MGQDVRSGCIGIALTLAPKPFELRSGEEGASDVVQAARDVVGPRNRASGKLDGAIARAGDEFEVVRHHKNDPPFRGKPPDEACYPPHACEIEPARRLVEREHVLSRGDTRRDREPLLLAARKRRRMAIGDVG